MYANTIINNRLHSPFVRKPFCIFIYFLALAAALAGKTSAGKICNETGNRNWASENIINIILCRGTTGSRDMGRRS